METLLANKEFVTAVIALTTFLGGKLWSWLDGKSGDKLSSFADRLQPLFSLVIATQPGMTLSKLHDLLITNAETLAHSIGIPVGSALDQVIAAEVSIAIDKFVAGHPTPAMIQAEIPAVVQKITTQNPTPSKSGIGLVSILFLVMFVLSCAPGTKATVVAGVKSDIQCVGVNLQQIPAGEVKPLSKLVADSLDGNLDGWQAYIEGLIVKIGEQAVACAVETYDNTPETPKVGMVAVQTGHQRAELLVAAKGWTFR